MGRLDGKVCVITGAGGGMGRDAAQLFTEEGASVCVADVDLAAAEETAARCANAFARQVDVADESSVEAMMAVHDLAFTGHPSPELGERLVTQLREAPELVQMVVAMAGETNIVTAEHIVPVGLIAPDHVMTPAPLVDYLVANR